MKIQSLSLRNFKGIPKFDLKPAGGNISVFGDNAAGKTTLFDAFLWLLFGKDSTGKTDFNIKPLTPDNKEIHHLETVVEAVLTIDGRTAKLKKVFKEKWTQKRGQVESEFSGHTTDYFINDVPVQKKEYDSRTGEIAREDVMRLLTNPAHFNSIHWQDRRRILLEVCGDLTEAEVISGNKALAKLPEILQGRTLEEQRKMIAARRKTINDEMEKIPVRISELQDSMSDLPAKTREQLEQEAAGLRKKRDAKQDELARIQNGGEVAEKTKALRQAEADLQAMANAKSQRLHEMNAGKQERIAGLNARISELHSKAYPSLYQYSHLETEAERLRKKWAEVNAREFCQPETCPTCGQALPAWKLDDAKKAFNLQKAEDLESITAQGKSIAAQIEQQKAANEGMNRDAQTAQAEIDRLKEEIAGLQREVSDSLKNAAPASPEMEAKSAEIEALRDEIASLRAGGSESAAKVSAEIAGFNQQIDGISRTIAVIEHHERTAARIAELEAEEKNLAREFESLSSDLFLTEEFIRSKVAMLEERINSRFTLARFKLFDTQLNGAVVECCETLYNGVPFGDGLNRGAQINVGLDICNTLADYYRFAPPVFVDNAEAVTRLIPTRGQVIRLVVSEPDKTLRIEGGQTNG